jgi:ribosome biogenesis protein Nip4
LSVKCIILDGDFIEILAKLFGNSVRKIFENRKIIKCSGVFTELYALSQEQLRVFHKLTSSGRYPYSAGMYLGRLRKRKPLFIPSITLLHLLYHSTGKPVRALMIDKNGLKPFLYGGDVLKMSVIKCYPPIEKGEIVSIIDVDSFVYGVALSTINDCDLRGLNETSMVARNIFDIGWYLRGGTEPREKKIKL